LRTRDKQYASEQDPIININAHLFAHGNKLSPTQNAHYTNSITISTSETSAGCVRELLSKEEEEEYATPRKVRLETISNSAHLEVTTLMAFQNHSTVEMLSYLTQTQLVCVALLQVTKFSSCHNITKFSHKLVMYETIP
jgi:hypothetical protein